MLHNKPTSKEQPQENRTKIVNQNDNKGPIVLVMNSSDCIRESNKQLMPDNICYNKIRQQKIRQKINTLKEEMKNKLSR